MQRSPHHSPSPPLSASLALSSGAAPSSGFILPPPPTSLPSVLTWLQPSSCSLWGEAAPLLFLPPSAPVSARCLLSVRLQSSPGDRRAMLKAFSQFQEDRGVRRVVGGLALSHHCFNPSNTGGSFSPPPTSPSPPSLLLGDEVYLLAKETAAAAPAAGTCSLSLLHDLPPATEGRARSIGAGPWAHRPAGAPLLSCV